MPDLRATPAEPPTQPPQLVGVQRSQGRVTPEREISARPPVPLHLPPSQHDSTPTNPLPHQACPNYQTIRKEMLLPQADCPAQTSTPTTKYRHQNR